MANKARHAFGSSAEVQKALQNGLIDAYDILFLDGDTDPKVGWIDRNGVFRLVENEADFSELREAIAAKADIADVKALEEEMTTKASSDEVDALEAEMATKVTAEEVDAKIADKADVSDVDAKIETAVSDTVATVNAYTDGKIEAAINEHMVKKYDITSVPIGTLVDYRDHEIRVMCPIDTKWVKQNVGGTGNVNMYYMAFKAYAPDGAVSFKEGDRGVIIDKMFDFNDDFAGTDEYGRNYSICWLALASYDVASNAWTYFGKNSSAEKYIGWDYVVEWYNADGIVIASDCVRINLSNEGCHTSIEPYYVSKMKTEVEEMVETKVAEVNSAYEIVEF